jgi:hypothetical protein
VPAFIVLAVKCIGVPAQTLVVGAAIFTNAGVGVFTLNGIVE